MSDEESGRSIKKSLGIVGAVVAIASICWFALGPRRHKKDDSPS